MTKVNQEQHKQRFNNQECRILLLKPQDQYQIIQMSLQNLLFNPC